MRLVRQILTSAREEIIDNVVLTPPIASSSRVETTKNANLIISEEEPSLITSINFQATCSPREQIRQMLSRHARTIPNNTQDGKVTEKPSSSLSKEKPSTMTFNSQTSSQICQTLSFQTRINSDDVQKKDTKESILMESSMPSDFKTEEELNTTIPVDSPSSSNAPVDPTIVKLNTKVMKRIA